MVRLASFCTSVYFHLFIIRLELTRVFHSQMCIICITTISSYTYHYSPIRRRYISQQHHPFLASTALLSSSMALRPKDPSIQNLSSHTLVYYHKYSVNITVLISLTLAEAHFPDLPYKRLQDDIIQCIYYIVHLPTSRPIHCLQFPNHQRATTVPPTVLVPAVYGC
jgi:hypothetical protein